MATLSSTIEADDPVLFVDDPTGMPAAGIGGVDDFVVTCENERILVQRRTGTVLWNLIRGYGGTVPARHLPGAAISVQSASPALFTRSFESFGGVMDLERRYLCDMTLGSTALTCDIDAFSLADVGKVVYVEGAGALRSFESSGSFDPTAPL